MENRRLESKTRTRLYEKNYPPIFNDLLLKRYFIPRSAFNSLGVNSFQFVKNEDGYYSKRRMNVENDVTLKHLSNYGFQQ